MNPSVLSWERKGEKQETTAVAMSGRDPEISHFVLLLLLMFPHNVSKLKIVFSQAVSRVCRSAVFDVHGN